MLLLYVLSQKGLVFMFKSQKDLFLLIDGGSFFHFVWIKTDLLYLLLLKVTINSEFWMWKQVKPDMFLLNVTFVLPFSTTN